MAKAWRCPCGAHNSKDRLDCRDCGGPPPGEKPEAGALVVQCWLDRATLAPDGRCDLTGGYPVPKDGSPLKCPFSCPHCRGGLSWDGGCARCFGAPSGKREDWTFPGDRYEVNQGHRVSVGGAGRRACSPDENQRSSLLAGVRVTPKGVELLDASW